jgi:hypothetical protein
LKVNVKPGLGWLIIAATVADAARSIAVNALLSRQPGDRATAVVRLCRSGDAVGNLRDMTARLRFSPPPI